MKVPEKWSAVAIVPTNRLKEIQFGALKGKSDINPQWRYKAMTEVYGMAGHGWYFTVDKTEFVPSVEGKISVFATVSLYTKDCDKWSMPVIGVGGNSFITKNKNGLCDNDECIKMAVTDALGNAMKYLGVGSLIYEGDFDGSKYRNPTDATLAPIVRTPQENLYDMVISLPDKIAVGLEICNRNGVTRLSELSEETARYETSKLIGERDGSVN